LRDRTNKESFYFKGLVRIWSEIGSGWVYSIGGLVLSWGGSQDVRATEWQRDLWLEDERRKSPFVLKIVPLTCTFFGNSGGVKVGGGWKSSARNSPRQKWLTIFEKHPTRGPAIKNSTQGRTTRLVSNVKNCFLSGNCGRSSKKTVFKCKIT
jgi:hypothetical protein